MARRRRERRGGVSVEDGELAHLPAYTWTNRNGLNFAYHSSRTVGRQSTRRPFGMTWRTYALFKPSQAGRTCIYACSSIPGLIEATGRSNATVCCSSDNPGECNRADVFGNGASSLSRRARNPRALGRRAGDIAVQFTDGWRSGRRHFGRCARRSELQRPGETSFVRGCFCRWNGRRAFFPGGVCRERTRA